MKYFTKKEEALFKKILSYVEDQEESLCVEELHGFFFGLAMTPDPIMPSEWLPIVFGENGPFFRSDQDAKEAIGHLMNLYNRFIEASNTRKLHFPFDLEKMSYDELHRIEDWAQGLFLGLSLRPDYWTLSDAYTDVPDEDIPEDLKSVNDATGIIVALALPEDRESIFTLPPDEEAMSEEEIEDLIYECLPESMEILLDHSYKMKEERLAEMPGEDSGHAASGPKVGRNDPCPCGSGKKYKKCCGAN